LLGGDAGKSFNMPRGIRHEAGHTLAETAIIIAAIAVFCALAAVFLGVAIKDRFHDAGTSPSAPEVFTPPATTPTTAYPTTLKQCEKGGWQHFPQFRTEQDCEDYVRSHAP